MSNLLIIKNKTKKYKKIINVSGDKSLSIRWVLFSSLADGKSKAKNLLMSEDVLAAMEAVKKLGIKVKIKKKECEFGIRGVSLRWCTNYKISKGRVDS